MFCDVTNPPEDRKANRPVPATAIPHLVRGSLRGASLTETASENAALELDGPQHAPGSQSRNPSMSANGSEASCSSVSARTQVTGQSSSEVIPRTPKLSLAVALHAKIVASIGPVSRPSSRRNGRASRAVLSLGDQLLRPRRRSPKPLLGDPTTPPLGRRGPSREGGSTTPTEIIRKPAIGRRAFVHHCRLRNDTGDAIYAVTLRRQRTADFGWRQQNTIHTHPRARARRGKWSRASPRGPPRRSDLTFWPSHGSAVGAPDQRQLPRRPRKRD
jgi:hypothetical protein